MRLEDVTGDFKSIIGMPVLLAEEVTHANITPEGYPPEPESSQSYTWTFYKLATVFGYVTLRWYGCSNGFYSERVDFWEEDGHD